MENFILLMSKLLHIVLCLALVLGLSSQEGKDMPFPLSETVEHGC